jgi:hypothetical protein
MKISTATSTTADSNLSTVLFSAQIDTDGYWLFVDRQSDVWGRGRSLLEAFCDYWAALSSHIAVLDDRPVSPRLEHQVEVMKWLRQAAVEDRVDGEDPKATTGTVT